MVFVWAIAVFTGLLLVLTFLLKLAETHLMDYGVCRITVRGTDRTVEADGGGTLLATLTDAGVFVPSACVGKGTCGYCRIRVHSGGGDVLATELPYLSRAEVRAHFRLACQVKVRGDMEVQIPDLLETVRAMVANKTYDTRKRWLWIASGDQAGPSRDPAVSHLSHEQVAQFSTIVKRHQHERDSLVPLLQEVNEAFNHIPEPAMRLIAAELKMPVSTVYRVATFYNAFSLKKKGRHTVSVCLGTACHVKGANNILAAIERELGIRSGGTTEDMLFSLQPVRCIGCCGLAPVVTIGEDVHGQLTMNKVGKMLESYRKETPHAQAAG